jgi:protein AbiQ
MIIVALHFKKGYFCIYYGGILLEYIYLTKDFYEKYENCSEIEKKHNRPYAMLLLRIDDVNWAIPLRSHINHKHVVWSDKENKCGLDLSKAVVIEDEKYISSGNPNLRQNEFNELKGKNYIVYNKMKNYIEKYIKAYCNQHIDRNKTLCKYSTLQYFHEYIPSLKESNINEAALTK